MSFARAGEVLRLACASGALPGAVGAVGTADGETYLEAFGSRDADRTAPMPHDAIFRLASMTKLVTAVAVLQLVEVGKLDLDAKVADFLPEFGRLYVLDGFDGDVPRLRPPARQATVRELLAHTSGASYEVWNSDILRYQQLTGTPAISSGRRAVLETPLAADPGSRAEYGTGYDWAGQLVERVAGVRLDDYCEEHVFAPLGMRRTSLERLEGEAAAYVPVLREEADGRFTLTSIDYPQGPEFVTGGGCFYSSAGDFLRLELALLRGGELDGQRVLERASVDELFEPQSGGLDVHVLESSLPELSCDVDVGPAWKWGFGLMVNTLPQPGRRPAGSGGWWGIFNTTFWIDRGSGVAGAVFMQFVPFYSGAAVAAANGFERAVYELLISDQGCGPKVA